MMRGCLEQQRAQQRATDENRTQETAPTPSNALEQVSDASRSSLNQTSKTKTRRRKCRVNATSKPHQKNSERCRAIQTSEPAPPTAGRHKGGVARCTLASIATFLPRSLQMALFRRVRPSPTASAIDGTPGLEAETAALRRLFAVDLIDRKRAFLGLARFQWTVPKDPADCSSKSAGRSFESVQSKPGPVIRPSAISTRVSAPRPHAPFSVA